MFSPAVLWPVALGSAFFVAGLYTYRRDLLSPSSKFRSGVFSLAPIFVAASLAAFGGEHFTAARALANLVPKWLPARLFIAYFVGVAHVAAALSLVARRCLRWSTLCLAVMFGLFVLLLHLPNAISNPTVRIAWVVAVRETTFAMGALSLFAVLIRGQWPARSAHIADIARIWSALVVIFFGILHFVYPRLSPGVPSTQPTASWVPFPLALAYVTGLLLIVCGIAMILGKHASVAAASAGSLMLFLTITLYIPQFFLARGVPERVNAINFVADTLLFSGTMLAIGNAILTARRMDVRTS